MWSAFYSERNIAEAIRLLQFPTHLPVIVQPKFRCLCQKQKFTSALPLKDNEQYHMRVPLNSFHRNHTVVIHLQT